MLKSEWYEVHRPKGFESYLAISHLFMPPHLGAEFQRAKEEAGTAGPELFKDAFRLIGRDEVQEVYDLALFEGMECYEDEITGYVHVMGEWVFVPRQS